MWSPAAALGVFRRWLASEFTAPDNQGVFQHVSLFEILQQPSQWFVSFTGVQIVVVLQVTVSIPVVVVVSTARINLHHSHAAFDHASGQQTLSTDGGTFGVVEAVKFLCGLGFLTDVHSFRGF